MTQSVTIPRVGGPAIGYEQIVEEALVGMYVSTPAGRLLFCNPAMARLLGFDSVDEALAVPLAALYDTPADREQFVDRVRIERRIEPHRARFRRRDGGFVEVLVTVIGGFDESGTLVELRGQVVDITETVAMEAALRDRLQEAQKIEMVGRLAGGVAHEFNNLLTAILGYTELLLATRQPGDPDTADLNEIYKAGQRAADLTRQLLAFGRKQVLVPKEIDLNDAAAAVRELLTRLIREDLRVTVTPAATPAIVRIDPVQFEQVVVNLVLNARDALPGGGDIDVAIARQAIDAAEAERDRRVPPGDYIVLRVSDNGVGMAPEVRAHLFEPFFTTKAFGKGTGLGLASVYGIVRQSSGHITVDSAPGAGTRVSVYLPALVGSGGASQVAQEYTGSAPRATILLVEDEDAVRVIVSAVLRRSGYRVLEASTPRGACDIFAAHADAIDLLLTDVIMPEMNGPALAQRLVADRPGLRVLFISGYADVAGPFAADNPNVAFLGKPFQASALVDRVRALLARPRPAGEPR